MSVQNDNPIELFEKWLGEEKKVSQEKHINAVCLSTLGLDGFPNARFVSLKEVINKEFVITTSFSSRKGLEIDNNNKVALTFWWKKTERQIRVQGTATKIPTSLAQKYFRERSRISQVVSSICEQGKETHTLETLEQEIQKTVSNTNDIKIPEDWGGYFIHPVRIEFMEFRESRFHDRKLYEKQEEEWLTKILQP